MTLQRIIGLVIGAILLVGGGWVAYDRTNLRLTSTSPKNDAISTTTTSVYFTFNHELDNATAQRFSIDPYIEGVATISKNQLIFKPRYSYKFDTNYSIIIKAPRSTGNLIGKDAKLSFKAGFVPIDQQTLKQQQDGLAHTDPLEKTNPFAASLPYETTHYKIDYVQGGDGNDFTYIITLYAVINGPADRPRYEAQLKQYKQEALDYIRDKKTDPASITINYLPNEAAAY